MNELEKICIYDPAGANYLLGKEWEFPITDKCERSAKVMGDDFVRLVFESTHKVVFDAFSFIRYKGQTFFLREKYIPKPKGTFKEDSGDVSTAYYSYDVKFVSVANMLDKYVCYRHVVVSGDKGGEWNEPEININGNLETMYKIIMGSIQQVAERLSDHMEFTSMLKTIPANGLNSDGTINTNKVKLTAGTKLLTFNFSGDKIANVCTTVANNFTNDDKKDTEWYITEDNGSLTLHFSKYVDEEYGVQYVSDYISNNNGADSSAHPQKSGGLKDVDYAQEWSGITNVIVPYGSTRNMTYQAAKGIDEVTQMQSTFGKRLRLKPNTYYYVKDKDGKDVSFLTDQQGAVRNTSVDTGIEEVRFYDEIYPQGHFKVTSVETKKKRQDGEIVPEYTVAGVAIDSKGNEIQPAEGFYPIAIEEGTTLSVRFEKGLLNGREFEIANKTRKDEGRTTYSLKFTIVADGSLEDGTLIPSGNFIPREGDEFALFNMKMPEVYITAAEHELAQRVYSDLEEAVSKRPEVKCTSDPTAWDKEMALGYQFQVKSEKFNSEDTFISRVISYSYKLTKPKEIQFNLASAIMQGTLSHMNDLIVDVTNQAGGLEQRAINLSRRGWRDAAEMAEMVDSLAADMMLVGNEKYQFAFTAGIEIVNSNNQTTAIKIGEGTLQHTQDPYISDYTCQGWWSHGAVTLNNGHTENGSASLVSLPDTPFYLYAVVGQNSDNISFELQDKEQDGEAYLLLGILSSAFMDTISGVTTNYRVFNRTNGYTQISGGTITTEQIQDAGRNLIIDFQRKRIIARNGAEIIGNIKFKASDEMTAEEQLAALGIDVDAAAQAAEQAAYTNIYNGGDISVSTDGSKEIALKDAFIQLATLGCYVKFTKVSETPLPPFGKSCIIAVKKGTDVSQIYLHKDDIYAYLNWGDEYTPTEECDFYVALAEKEYIRGYLIPGAFDFIEYDMRDVWTISGINVIVRTSDAIQSAMQAIANEEDARMEALAAAVSNINGGIDELQKQIDGEVSSYFYDIAPIDEDETILTDIPPFNEWAENYNLQNGVYVLKAGARNEFVNHIGDTYTNMEEYKEDSNGNTTTPLAGLSWRWCDATTVSPLPKKYITIRYTSNGSITTKKLHWHKIADSDAVKALQEAGRAQSTADGKSTIYSLTGTNRPTNYQKGDMWILQSDTIHPGGKKGDILNANQDSATYAESHWTKEVSYIDEEVAAQKAQEALDDLELGGTNLLTGSRTGEGWSQYTSFADGVYYSENNTSGEKYIYSPKNLKLTKGTYTLSFDFKTDGFKKYSGTDNEGIQLFFLDGDFSPMNHHRIQYADISTNWKHYIWTFEVEEDCSGDAYIRFDNDRTSSYTNPTKLWVKDIKLEKGNKATGWSPAPEDVDSKADAIRAIANEALTDANAAMKNLDDMSSDSILTPQEKVSVANEWACIQEEYAQNSTNKTAAWGSATVAEWTAYNTAYTTLQTYVSTLALTDRTNNTTIVKSTFQANFANYYSANVAFLNALSKKVAELEVAAMEIGGRNLLKNSNVFSISQWGTSNATYTKGTEYATMKMNVAEVMSTCTLAMDVTNNKDYIFNKKWKDKNICISVAVKSSKDIGLKVGIVIRDSSDVNISQNYYNAPYINVKAGEWTRIYSTYKCAIDADNVRTIYLVIGSSTTCSIGDEFNIKDWKIEFGNKATDWTPAPEDVDAKVSALDYLKKALENDTDIAGGIVATTHISLRDWTGEYESDGKTKKYKVNAGLSGIKDDNILVFGGGTYEEAVNAADPDNDFHVGKNKTGRQITSLIKKDGTGKIGIFKVSDTQAVVDVPNQGSVVIDASSTNGGIFIRNKSGENKISIKNGEIGNDFIPEEFTDTGKKSFSFSNVLCSGSSGTCSTQRSADLWEDMVETYSNGTNTVIVKFINMSFRQMLRYSGTTPTANTTAKVILYAKKGGGGYSAVATKTLTLENVTSGSNYVSELTYQNFKLTHTSSSAYTYLLSVEVNGKDHYACLGDFMMEGNVEWSWHYVESSTPQTIIGTDGIATIYNNNAYFMVKNTSTGQKVYAKGLSTTKGTAGSGELYVSKASNEGLVKSLYDGFAAISEVLQYCRYEGSNASAQKNAKTACDNIRNALAAISIIANS